MSRLTRQIRDMYLAYMAGHHGVDLNNLVAAIPILLNKLEEAEDRNRELKERNDGR